MIQPLDDRLLVRLDPADTEVHGLIIPEIARKRGDSGGDKFLRTGVVLGVGPGDKWRIGTVPRKDGTWPIYSPPAGGRFELDVQPGDRVLFEFSGEMVYPVEGEDVVFLREEQHVMAVIG